jgi:hypothetical protein
MSFIGRQALLLLLLACVLPAQQRSGADTGSQLLSNFKNPPAEFRSMPLWVWNDELDWPRLQQQLAQFKQQGMGGVERFSGALAGRRPV